MQMQSLVRATLLLALAALLPGCGGGSGGGGSSPPPPPAPQAKTYAVTATSIELRRSADGLALPTDTLPAEGATLTVD